MSVKVTAVAHRVLWGIVRGNCEFFDELQNQCEVEVIWKGDPVEGDRPVHVSIGLVGHCSQVHRDTRNPDGI